MDDPSVGGPNQPKAQTAQVDAARCSGCGRCISACELRLFAFETQHWKKTSVLQEPERCTGCGACTARCPTDAVQMADGQITAANANKVSLAKLRGILPQPEHAHTTKEMNQAVQDAATEKSGIAQTDASQAIPGHPDAGT